MPAKRPHRAAINALALEFVQLPPIWDNESETAVLNIESAMPTQ